jgi:hypothetical protein
MENDANNEPEIIEGELVEETSYPEIHPWEQMPDEKPRWYNAFFTWFLLMGPSRTILASFRKYRQFGAQEGGKPFDSQRPGDSRHWYFIARKYDWESRAEAWDTHNREKELAKWEKRREEHREAEWVAAEQMLATANAHLSKIDTVSEPTDQPVRSAKESGRVQARLKPSDVVRFVETGSKVGRQASEMGAETVNVKVSVELDEVRKQRWTQVAPNLQKVLSEGNIEDEADNEPPMDGVVDSNADSE